VSARNSTPEKTVGTVSVVFTITTMMLSSKTVKVIGVDELAYPVVPVIVDAKVPFAVGVPEITPVLEIPTPVGRPVAEKDTTGRPDKDVAVN
jgi:hypothetical protein